MVLRTDKPVRQSQKVQNLHKRNYNEKAIDLFKQRLREIDWIKLKKCEDPNKACKHFFQFLIIFSQK